MNNDLPVEPGTELEYEHCGVIPLFPLGWSSGHDARASVVKIAFCVESRLVGVSYFHATSEIHAHTRVLLPLDSS